MSPRSLSSPGAREHRVFGGRLDKRGLGFGEKALVRMVGAADGDYRPWDEIEAWADEIASILTASTQGASRQAPTNHGLAHRSTNEGAPP